MPFASLFVKVPLSNISSLVVGVNLNAKAMSNGLKFLFIIFGHHCYVLHDERVVFICLAFFKQCRSGSFFIILYAAVAAKVLIKCIFSKASWESMRRIGFELDWQDLLDLAIVS